MGGLPFPRPLSYNMMQMRRLENWARLVPSVMAIIHTLSQRPLKLFTQKDRDSIPTQASNREFILWLKSPGYPPPSPEPVESQTAPCTGSSRAVQSKTCLPLSHCVVLLQSIVNATLWFETSKLSQCCGENKQEFVITRPKPVYGKQGLDWTVGPGYSSGGYILGCS